MAGSGTAHVNDETGALVQIRHLVVEHHLRNGQAVQAVSDVSLDIKRGETLGLVGESGCGKSSFARAIMMLVPPTSGQIRFDGRSLMDLSARDLRRLRSRFQMIFQDPVSSFNSRRTVRELVAEGLSINHHPRPWDPMIREILDAVGMDLDRYGDSRPKELSGGQAQRVGLARSIVLEPSFLVCDEAVSALDVSVQAQVLNLLRDLKERYGLTVLFISHDIAAVKNVSDRVTVMYWGKLCEVAPMDDLHSQPQHPYTQLLLASADDRDPGEDVDVAADRGPTASEPPQGCRFHPRCPRAKQQCIEQEPTMRPVSDGHWVACHFPGSPVPDEE